MRKAFSRREIKLLMSILGLLLSSCGPSSSSPESEKIDGKEFDVSFSYPTLARETIPIGDIYPDDSDDPLCFFLNLKTEGITYRSEIELSAICEDWGCFSGIRCEEADSGDSFLLSEAKHKCFSVTGNLRLRIQLTMLRKENGREPLKELSIVAKPYLYPVQEYIQSVPYVSAERPIIGTMLGLSSFPSESMDSLAYSISISFNDGIADPAFVFPTLSFFQGYPSLFSDNIPLEVEWEEGCDGSFLWNGYADPFPYTGPLFVVIASNDGISDTYPTLGDNSLTISWSLIFKTS